MYPQLVQRTHISISMNKEFICVVRGHQIVVETEYKYSGKSRRTHKVTRCIRCGEKLMPRGTGGWITTWQWALEKIMEKE